MKKLIFALAIGFSLPVHAAPEYVGKIDGFYVNAYETVLIKLDVPTPACVDTNWPFQFSTSDVVAKEWTSMILAAKTSQEQIYIGYSPPDSSGRCGVEYFYFK